MESSFRALAELQGDRVFVNKFPRPYPFNFCTLPVGGLP